MFVWHIIGVCVCFGRHEKLSMDDLMAQCKHVFGDDVISADCNTGEFNTMYGGATLGNGDMASKIVFLDYSDDPWNQASVQKPLSSTLPYCMTVCNGCGKSLKEKTYKML